MVKRVSLLGSTGSIGSTTLQVAEHLKDSIEVVALAAQSNINDLETQARKFNPLLVAVGDKERARELKKRLPDTQVVGGKEGLLEAATIAQADTVVVAINGAAALEPTAAAIQAGKAIALASKEVLVAGGGPIMALAKRHNVSIIPIDSEHSAIFQCLHGEEPATLKRVILTSSGGPFRNLNASELEQVTLEQALAHPNYSMGAKVTVDSSTLMNKGLEVIEAYWLFGLPLKAIEVVIHPQQFIHSMVEYADGSILGQMGEPHMLLPIQYALTYPQRLPSLMQPFDFTQPLRVDFCPPNLETFRCLQLAYDAQKEGGTLPCAMNAANEELVRRFLGGDMPWIDIGRKLQILMERHRTVREPTLEALLSVDQETRQQARTA